MKKTLITVLAFALLGPITTLAQQSQLINLRTAGDFAVLAETRAAAYGQDMLVVGDVGVNGPEESSISGSFLPLTRDSDHSTSGIVTGRVYANNYQAPTPTKLTTAVADMRSAFNTISLLIPPPANINLLGGQISGQTLGPGFYDWNSSTSESNGYIYLNSNTTLTLAGDSDDIFILRMQGLTLGQGAKILLSGDVLPQHVFIQSRSTVTLGNQSETNGIILAQNSIFLHPEATLTGKALSQRWVSLDANAFINNVTPAVLNPTNVNSGIVSAIPPDLTTGVTPTGPTRPTTSPCVINALAVFNTCLLSRSLATCASQTLSDLNTCNSTKTDALSCSPTSPTALPGQEVVFTATGGSGAPYTWTTSADGNPPTGNDPTFRTTYYSQGQKFVTVRDGSGAESQCTVYVGTTILPIPSCSPDSPTVNVGDPVTFTASGGTFDGGPLPSGNYYVWDGSGTPSNGIGEEFFTRYSTAGEKVVYVAIAPSSLVSSVGMCRVNVVGSDPRCLSDTNGDGVCNCRDDNSCGGGGSDNIVCRLYPSGAPDHIAPGSSISFIAVGDANGTRHWTAEDGQPNTAELAEGETFTTFYPIGTSLGPRRVLVEAGGRHDECPVFLDSSIIETHEEEIPRLPNAGLDPNGQQRLVRNILIAIGAIVVLSFLYSTFRRSRPV